MACSSAAAPPPGGDGNEANKEDDNTPAASTSPPGTETNPITPPPPTTTPVAMGKIREAPVRSYAVTNDALFVATGTAVERTTLDGATPTPFASLAGSISLASDGLRVFGLIDRGFSVLELTSVQATDGMGLAVHAGWDRNQGEPMALALSEGRLILTTRRANPRDSIIVSMTTSAINGNTPWRIEERVESQFVTPAFTAGRLFAVDYFRQSAVRVSLVDSSESVDVIMDELPTSAGGIATDGLDVYTRTARGIVKVPVGASSNTLPTVVIPSATCSIFDPGTGAVSVLEDDLAVDATTIYTACRAGANIEIRAYGKDGTLVKVVGTTPYTGGVTNLRVGTTSVYWLSRSPTLTASNELWRAGK
jgi:hypothetical protein